MSLIAQLPVPEALMRRALELDESWGQGAVHEFWVSFEAARPGGTEAWAKAHLDRAVELAHGAHLGVWVSWAEGPLVAAQRRASSRRRSRRYRGDAEASVDDRLANHRPAARGGSWPTPTISSTRSHSMTRHSSRL
jgi:hypothetical protein